MRAVAAADGNREDRSGSGPPSSVWIYVSRAVGSSLSEPSWRRVSLSFGSRGTRRMWKPLPWFSRTHCVPDLAAKRCMSQSPQTAEPSSYKVPPASQRRPQSAQRLRRSARRRRFLSWWHRLASRRRAYSSIPATYRSFQAASPSSVILQSRGMSQRSNLKTTRVPALSMNVASPRMNRRIRGVAQRHAVIRPMNDSRHFRMSGLNETSDMSMVTIAARLPRTAVTISTTSHQASVSEDCAGWDSAARSRAGIIRLTIVQHPKTPITVRELCLRPAAVGAGDDYEELLTARQQRLNRRRRSAIASTRGGVH